LPVEPGAFVPRGGVFAVEEKDRSGRGQVAEGDGRRRSGRS
jgi:hypothetical protein